MSTDIKAPQFPESVQDGSIATWHKKVGEPVSRDELLVDIETDKVVMEVVAPADGSLTEILKDEGDTVQSTEVIAKFKEGAADKGSSDDKGGKEKGEQKDKGEKAKSKEDEGKKDQAKDGKQEEEKLLSPAARRIADENNIDPQSVPGTGKDGRVTKEDVVSFLSSGSKASSESAAQPAGEAAEVAVTGDRPEKRVPMTRLRKRIAERLLEASNTTAMLTTFNEVNMAPIMELRAKYKDKFEKTHDGARLGFMGFFVKAAVEALRRFPAVNASIDNNDIVYHGYQDVGVAVSTEKGLVVPVLRNAQHMGLADIESTVRDYGLRARDGKLSIEEMTGGTFTITNGGVFGSLLSTPILNLPQSAILGMHKIQERPMAVNGEVKILPMMYLALSYDHRLLDGKEAVQFLVAIKDLLEDPARILLEV
ncbi:2-oxoglutarate dehydrogenase complex dihydrolipoyllysine-residue succinyltransferase [Marinimicrobium sp. ABcell2]|uniref:2-oxoglutarate dehydrogenase complex dihydrolipoyllysine-residue succinyltransferase n=1 Tax=Marinimicrobium sp. ABcell2 TaxID=3069751 RepID=UPI0027B20CB7|nr:2-oxoglutarate dehydrogenase complex dihydrolipoyllysine-residue succinyltransferase [Marinimicrobium sp. ABcell2]MDQ2075433.1 2-oxoglutarate dehydrogenase complex dihydrolipoyllysine-residue succinyltransferase [Marinimicrobium sp. ABcell2]